MEYYGGGWQDILPFAGNEPGSGTKITVPAETVVMNKAEPWGRLKAETTYRWPHVEDKAGKKVDLSVLPADNVVADEIAFITNIKEPWYAVVNPYLKLGFALRWDLSVFPGLWFWQSYRKGEPSRKLEGNASLESQLTATVFPGVEKVKTVNPDGAVAPS